MRTTSIIALLLIYLPGIAAQDQPVIKIVRQLCWQSRNSGNDHQAGLRQIKTLGPKGTRALITLIVDRQNDYALRNAALTFLSQVGEKNDLQHLLPLLLDRRDCLRIRAKILDLAFSWRYPHLARLLVVLFQKGCHRGIGIARRFKALAIPPGDKLYSDLFALLQHREFLIRLEICRLFTTVANPRVIPRLDILLKQELSPYVRRWALAALIFQRKDDNANWGLLQRYLRDPSPLVRSQAFSALASLPYRQRIDLAKVVAFAVREYDQLLQLRRQLQEATRKKEQLRQKPKADNHSYRRQLHQSSVAEALVQRNYLQQQNLWLEVIHRLPGLANRNAATLSLLVQGLGDSEKLINQAALKSLAAMDSEWLRRCEQLPRLISGLRQYRATLAPASSQAKLTEKLLQQLNAMPR